MYKVVVEDPTDDEMGYYEEARVHNWDEVEDSIGDYVVDCLHLQGSWQVDDRRRIVADILSNLSPTSGGEYAVTYQSDDEDEDDVETYHARVTVEVVPG